MVELGVQGFVRVEPRKGAVVNRFLPAPAPRPVLETIVLRNGGELSPSPRRRPGIQAPHRTEPFGSRAARPSEGSWTRCAISSAAKHPRRDRAEAAASLDLTCDLDFEFHLAVAEASGSLATSLVNSFRPST